MAAKLPWPDWAAPFGRLAIANTLSNLMVPLAGLIDTAFLGHLTEIRHLAGVALATLIFNVIYWSFGFLRMGTTGLVAQSVGRRNSSEVWIIGLRGGLLALALGVILVCLQWPIRELGFAVLQGDGTVLEAGKSFYDGRIWGAPAVLINYVLLGLFLGQGQGQRVLWLSLVANGGNILLDYWFIRGLGWASYGAGLATALSQGMMLLVGIGFVLSARPWQLFPTPDLNRQNARRPWPYLWLWLRMGKLGWQKIWDISALRTLFQLNRDILIRTFALVISFALFTNLSAAMGTYTLAVNTLLLQVVTLAAYGLDGIAFATETYAGQFYGRGEADRLHQLVTAGSCLSLLIAVAVAIAFIQFPTSLFSLLTDHLEILNQVPIYVPWLLPVLAFGAIAFMLDGYFLGLTAGHILRQSTVLATCVGFIPLAIVAHWQQNPHFLWLALTSFMATRAITLGRAVPKTWTP